MSFLNLVEMSNKFEVPAFLFLALSTLIKKKSKTISIIKSCSWVLSCCMDIGGLIFVAIRRHVRTQKRRIKRRISKTIRKKVIKPPVKSAKRISKMVG